MFVWFMLLFTVFTALCLTSLHSQLHFNFTYYCRTFSHYFTCYSTEECCMFTGFTLEILTNCHSITRIILSCSLPNSYNDRSSPWTTHAVLFAFTILIFCTVLFTSSPPPGLPSPMLQRIFSSLRTQAYHQCISSWVFC